MEKWRKKSNFLFAVFFFTWINLISLSRKPRAVLSGRPKCLLALPVPHSKLFKVTFSIVTFSVGKMGGETGGLTYQWNKLRSQFVAGVCRMRNFLAVFYHLVYRAFH